MRSSAPPRTLPTTDGAARRAAQSCAGVVLAGGLSTRMGRPKAALLVDGVPLVQRVVDRLRQAFDEVWVVAAAGQSLPPTDAPVARDARSASGPLGGLEAALSAAASDAVFAVSCDLPSLQPALARRMVELSRGFDAAIPRWDGRLHPLLGVYGRSLLPQVRALLDAGRLRPVFLLEHGRTRIVEDTELRPADPAGLSFRNVNTPDELAAALAELPPRVSFELYGEPRVLAGRTEIQVDVPAPATLGSALAALGREAPELAGHVLGPDGSLPSAFLVGLDGRGFTRDRGRPVAHGERLMLLAASAGG